MLSGQTIREDVRPVFAYTYISETICLFDVGPIP